MDNLLTQNLDIIQQKGLPSNKIPATLGELISTLLPYIFSIAGIGLLIFLVLAGLQMMTSRGDPKAMQAAQSKITTALIGFIIIFLSYSLVKLMGQILGVPVFGNIFK